jgi:GT2 family glycosyltransferase
VLNWDGKELLKANMPSVAKAAAYYPNTREIIVVDNGSTDDSVDFLRSKYPQVKILELGKNMRFTGGNNAGVEYASGDIVILLNNDMWVGEKFIPPLINGFKSRDNVFAVSSQVYFLDKNKRREESGLTKAWFKKGWLLTGHVVDQEKIDKVNDYEPAFWAGGGSTAFDRKKFLEIKLDTLYDPFYLEDIDISYQAWKRGYANLFAKNSKVYHMHRATNRVKYGDDYIDTIRERNTYLFIWKNITDLPMIIGHIFRLPFIVSEAVRERGRGEFAVFMAALKELPQCIARRRANRRFYRLRDREIFAMFSQSTKPQPISSIDFSFGDFDENIKGNWYSRELNYRWIGKSATCLLYSSNKRSKLIISGCCGIPQQLMQKKQYIISVYFNNKMCARLPIEKGELNIEQDVGDTLKQLNEIRIEMNDTYNNNQLGIGEDIRDLGVIINKVEII